MDLNSLKGKKIAVGMSGGVDSSVSALLLKEAGAEVFGLFMRNWEDDEQCPAEKDFHDVVAVAEKIKIPFYSVNFAKEYWDDVFNVCLKQFSMGLTPNPDILCNREIKFHRFLNKALELGADFLATGHYCRNEKGSLLRGIDPNKDQSYFLYTIQEKQLAHVLFPVGNLPKTHVRKIAAEHGLITAQKKDSTGICFIGKRDFREFLSKYMAKKRGVFKTPEGKEVGEHEGAHLYTIGQRKGMGIGGEGPPWFVYAKDMEANTVYVVQGEEHPLLFKNKLIAKEISWVNALPSLPLTCTAKIRYRSPDVPCTVLPLDNDRYEVCFETPQKAPTPGQSIVFYLGEICLGGGIIF